MGTAHWHPTIERTVTGLNYELVDVERSAAGLLRVFIDRPLDTSASEAAGADAPAINVDDCERVTRQLQMALDVDDVPYQRLEVSSPGLDRPLKEPAHYRRFAGQEIELMLKLPFNGRKNYRGRLLPAGTTGTPADDAWRLALAGDHAGQTLDFTLDEVRTARLVPVIDFKGRAAPGKVPKRAAGQGKDGGH